MVDNELQEEEMTVVTGLTNRGAGDTAPTNAAGPEAPTAPPTTPAPTAPPKREPKPQTTPPSRLPEKRPAPNIPAPRRSPCRGLSECSFPARDKLIATLKIG